MDVKGNRVNVNDLHLSYVRSRSSNWESKSSPARYVQPVTCYSANDCSVHVQGTCLNTAGELLSVQEVCELIVKKGVEALDYLDGSFVIAVSDARDGSVWCATDINATIPIYYKQNSAELIVTTRPENMRVKDCNELDLQGMISFLNTGYPWGQLTLLKEWKVLRPGQILSIDNKNNATIKNYFDPEADERIKGFTSPEELLGEIEKAIVSIHSRYKKVLVPLSGGVDSRLIALQCHKLGIPFEVITFVANVGEGSDFDIASRLVKVFNVKHHRWEWSPSQNTIENFKQLCIASGGTNDAYTTYPDGMKFFADIASNFDCILRGDHNYGFGSNTDSLFRSALDLCINFKDDLNWTLKPDYKNKVNIEAVFEEQEQVSIKLKGELVNHWRHKSRRLTRNPRQHLPIGQLQAQFKDVGYPLITRTIVERMGRTEIAKRNDKLLAFEALAAGSPPDIKRIPFEYNMTWKGGEPLLNLPVSIFKEMIEIISKPSLLSEVVDEKAVIDQFNLYLNSRLSNGIGRVDIKSKTKKLLKNLMPKGLMKTYKTKIVYPKVGPHLVFKRLFAMKVYLDSITER